MKKSDLANLTTEELNKVLANFKGKQQPRVITGIHDNQGILTHDVCGTFYCNNVPDIAQNANPRLACHSLKLMCEPQEKETKLTNSYRWYLCRIGSKDSFDISVKSANDEVAP